MNKDAVIGFIYTKIDIFSLTSEHFYNIFATKKVLTLSKNNINYENSRLFEFEQY